MIAQWSSLDIGVAGIPPLQNIGVIGIDYEIEAAGVNDVFGQGTPVKIGETLGDVKSTASLTVLRVQSAVLLQALSAALSQGGKLGFLEWRFPIACSCAMPDGSIQTDNIIGARIVKIANAHKQGTEALTEKWDLRCFFTVKAGIMPIGKSAAAIFQTMVPSP
jgi:hypothetical protein